MKKLMLAVIAVLSLMMISCVNTNNKSEADATVDNENVAIVKSTENKNADPNYTTLTCGDTKIKVEQIKRDFSYNDEFYVKFDIYAIPDAPKMLKIIDEYIASNYTSITDQKPDFVKVSTVNNLSHNIDAIGKNFLDVVVPSITTDEYALQGFDMEVTMRPTYAFGKYVTYETFLSYYSGGAHPNGEQYLFTVDPQSGEILDFDSLVKASDRMTVKEALVKTIAKSNSMSVADYLADAKEFIMPGDDRDLTVENFPIVYVAVTSDALVFCYPPYAIAPYAAGNLTYELPLASVRPYLKIKV